jgi:hypothetical protein
MARKSVVEFYDTDTGRRSKAPAIAVSTQWDSSDSIPTGRESTTINSAHTTTAKYHTHTQLWNCFHPSYSPLLLLRWAASQVQFVFCNEPIWFLAWAIPLSTPILIVQFDWPIGKEGWNYEDATKKKILWKDGVSPLPPPLRATYRGEKRKTLGKTYGIKQGAIGNTHGEQIGNLLGTEEKWKKSSSCPPRPNLKENNKVLWVQAEPSHWLHETSIPKTVCHHFQPSLIPPL